MDARPLQTLARAQLTLMGFLLGSTGARKVLIPSAKPAYQRSVVNAGMQPQKAWSPLQELTDNEKETATVQGGRHHGKIKKRVFRGEEGAPIWPSNNT